VSAVIIASLSRRADEDGCRAGSALMKYSSVSEYVRDLVREDQKRQTQENLAVLREATRSGPGREFRKADWEALRRELAKRLAKRSSK
jgi:Arc/MetJ-type ribon-helix-helix transcriptional regulator